MGSGLETPVASQDVDVEKAAKAQRNMHTMGVCQMPWTFLASGATLVSGARYPSGKGEVCKTFMRRFDSDPRLQLYFLLSSHRVIRKQDVANPAHPSPLGN
jgi:hypothetical protein